MKKNFMLITLVSMLCISARAATTFSAWTFENVSAGINSSPAPSTGLGMADGLGMANSYNDTNSVSNPDVQLLAGSSSGGANGWRIRGYSTVAGSRGNGWSTNAPVGTQGAQFSGSTFGYYQIQVSFDVYATADAEANLQVQYSTDGSIWNNASIVSGGSSATLQTNTSSANTVIGKYVKLASGWNNQITVDLRGLSGVDNDASFSIRLVNASTSDDCVDTTGAIYNNTSGNWTFDNVMIQGTSIDTIAGWSFESEPNDGTIITNPVPEIGGAPAGQAFSLGFNNGYTYSGSGNGTGSTDASDVSGTSGASSSGANGPNCWRVRGARLSDGKAGVGWNFNAPIGTQGAEFDASTAGYSNIVVAFDLYFTSAAEARMCVLYTTDGWATTNVANSLFYGGDATTVHTNTSNLHIVAGTYFNAPNSQGFYNNLIVDFTGVSGVDNNAQFGFKIVNAATGPADCLNLSGGTYNNSSGNWRYDNVTVGGTAGTPPPAIAFDANATVDAPFTNTFADDAAWRSRIAAIYVNGVALINSAYTTNTPGMIVFTPSTNAPVLTSRGLKNISILSIGYGTAKVAQPLAAGVATQLAITTQAAGPTASGGTLVDNPVLLVSDQYGNGTTNPYPNVAVTASAGGAIGWTLGGDTNQPSVDGLIAFTNLTATVNGTSPVAGAVITFTISGYGPLSVTNSPAFNIGAPPANFTPGNLAVLQLDKSANNTTFSIVEIKPSIAGQTNPVNVVPISATGTNALRMSNSGSCGKLSLSDDGTLLCFAAFVDASAATADETLNLNRAAAGLNCTNLLNIGMTYHSTSLGGSQARSCTALGVDNSVWITADKGGLYQVNPGGETVEQPNLNAYNNVVVKTFGGVPYVQTQKANGPALPVLYYLGFDSDTGLYDVTPYTPGLVTDPAAGDFYMISTNGGASYDVLYILDQNSETNGAIKKFSLVSGSWVANGTFINGTGGDSLFATTNGNGGVYLYLTTAPKSGINNSVLRVTDASGWNAPINIISTNVIYTATGGTFLKGLTFVPQPAAYAAELIPPPILTAQNGAAVSRQFTITCSPDDAAWQSAIFGVTVNGSTLPSAAYNTTQSGQITFDPTQSTLLQIPGLKTIVIGATGYSDDTVIQTLSVLPSLLGGISLNGGSLTFAFTNGAGLNFSVLATNNVAAPVATWPVIGTAVESPSGSGHYQYTDLKPATNASLFYILRQP